MVVFIFYKYQWGLEQLTGPGGKGGWYDVVVGAVERCSLQLGQNTRWNFKDTLPAKLAWMAASKLMLDVAIQFKLKRMPPSKFPTNSNSVANHPSHCV
jgi:hypothetical protein